MTPPLIIPDTAVAYILFQRAYFRLPITAVYRLLNALLPGETPLYNLAVALESRVGRQRTKALYAAEMQHEYASLQPYLPPRCSAVLDIGCGVAGIDVLLYRHYAPTPIDLYLLDKSQVTPRVYYLFQPHGAFYNSLDVATELLTLNGVPAARMHPREANARDEIRVDTRLDLVLSLLSWGFHYPVTTYVDRVHEQLHQHGVAILDVRKGTDGLDVLQQKFRTGQIIDETKQRYRIAVGK